MLHQTLELRRILKTFLRNMNDIPFELRDEDIRSIRTKVIRKVDELGMAAYTKVMTEYNDDDNDSNNSTGNGAKHTT